MIFEREWMNRLKNVLNLWGNVTFIYIKNVDKTVVKQELSVSVKLRISSEN